MHSAEKEWSAIIPTKSTRATDPPKPYPYAWCSHLQVYEIQQETRALTYISAISRFSNSLYCFLGSVCWKTISETKPHPKSSSADPELSTIFTGHRRSLAVLPEIFHDETARPFLDCNLQLTMYHMMLKLPWVFGLELTFEKAMKDTCIQRSEYSFFSS